jgi:formate/nitrite transporter FocA (FNT family)
LSPSKLPLSGFVQWPCVSATAGNTVGTGFLVSSVYWLVIVPEYQEHAGNGTLVAVISFSGTR